MKKTVRFAALAAALSVTFCLAMGNKAEAGPPCSYLHGRSCTGNPGWVYCTTDEGQPDLCYCITGSWYCGYAVGSSAAHNPFTVSTEMLTRANPAPATCPSVVPTTAAPQGALGAGS